MASASWKSLRRREISLQTALHGSEYYKVKMQNIIMKGMHRGSDLSQNSPCSTYLILCIKI